MELQRMAKPPPSVRILERCHEDEALELAWEAQQGLTHSTHEFLHGLFPIMSPI
jgi:hypothetical protein